MSKESAYTSTRQIPALFKLNVLHGTNFDFGGGKYDDGSKYLATQGVTNLVYDPFCRSDNHNGASLQSLEESGVDSITCLNVLNVIKDDEERLSVIKQIAGKAHTNHYRHMKFPTVFFQIYEGDRTGTPHPKNSQLNRRTADYINEITEVFENCEITKKKNIITINLK
jgi:hypothetical protein